MSESYGRPTEAKRERSRRGQMRPAEPCLCGCKSWVRTKAGRQICGYCAWPDASDASARAER